MFVLNKTAATSALNTGNGTVHLLIQYSGCTIKGPHAIFLCVEVRLLGPLNLWKQLYNVFCGSGNSFYSFDNLLWCNQCYLCLGMVFLQKACITNWDHGIRNTWVFTRKERVCHVKVLFICIRGSVGSNIFAPVCIHLSGYHLHKDNHVNVVVNDCRMFCSRSVTGWSKPHL